MKRLFAILFAASLVYGQGSFTPASGVYADSDGSIEIGVESNFTGGGEIDKTWPIMAISAYELEGTVAMRSEGKADILVRIYLDSRLILNENLKTPNGGPYSANLQVHIPPAALQMPASTMKVMIEAAGSGNAWPVNCEVEMSGRWQ